MFSAWLYGEVYIWSRTSKDRLGFTDLGRAHERLKLNERPLYLRFLFVVLATAQSAVHLWHDYDSIHVPAMVPKRDRDLNNTESAAAVRSTPKPRQTLLRKLPGTIALSGGITGFAFCLGSLVYFVGPRHLIWDYYYSFSRYVISLSKTSRPTGLAPFLPLVFGYAAEGTLLVLLWQFVNQAFDLYITQEPVKNNQPITFDSKDPNGTLLNGLKSKKDTPKVARVLP
jgi:nucleoporin NDC1